MKAIFTGNLADGLCLVSIVPDEAAPHVVSAYLAQGTLADALPVNPPSHLSKQAPDYPLTPAACYICFGTSLGGGFTLYGPFPDNDIAEDFGETYRPEDSEWELFEVCSG